MMGGDRASIELNNQKTDFFYVNNGLSVVAIDEASGKLAGALCAKDSDPEGVGCGSICSIMCMLCKLYRRNKKLMSTTIAFTNEMMEPMEKSIEEIMKKNNIPKRGVAVEMISIATSKDFGRRGIGATMTNLVKDIAIKRGYHLAYAFCSSAFSTKALTKNGGKIEKTMMYKDYIKDGKCPFEGKIEEPHVAYNLVVFRFKEEAA